MAGARGQPVVAGAVVQMVVAGIAGETVGQGGAEQAAKDMSLPFLGRVPLALEIRTASDAGTPPAAGDGPQGESFAAIARRLSAWLTERNA